MNGQDLRRRRKHLGFSQEQLAHLLGVTRQSVYKWERNMPPTSWTMLDLALQTIEKRAAWIDLMVAMQRPAVEEDGDGG